jgi:hypothetical protein
VRCGFVGVSGEEKCGAEAEAVIASFNFKESPKNDDDRYLDV